MIDTRLDPRDHLYIGTGFRLASSNLTLDDLEGSKIKVILFNVKISRTATVTMLCWIQRRLYRVPMGFTLDDLEKLKAKVTILCFEISRKR